VLLLLVTVIIDADVVCTFIGEGPDIIHNINLKYKSSIRISAPGKELIKRVVYNKRNFKVVNNLHELIVRPKTESLCGYLTVFTERVAPATGDVTKRYSSQKKSSQKNKILAHRNTEENYIYIFKLKTIGKEDKSNHFDQHIIIKR
jgi:hypothetical protein